MSSGRRQIIGSGFITSRPRVALGPLRVSIGTTLDVLDPGEQRVSIDSTLDLPTPGPTRESIGVTLELP